MKILMGLAKLLSYIASNAYENIFTLGFAVSKAGSNRVMGILSSMH